MSSAREITGENEEITLAVAARLIPKRNGKTRHVRTLVRWIVKGCRGARLRGWKRGNDWYTTPANIEQFTRDCTERAGVIEIRPPAEVSAAVARARDLLRRKGFYGKQGCTSKGQATATA